MLLALARYVIEFWYRPEGHPEHGEIWTFNNMCTGELERVTAVLTKVGVLRPLDGYGQRSTLNCGPGKLEGIADAASAGLLPDKEIEEAVIRLATGNHRASLEIEWLAKRLTTER